MDSPNITATFSISRDAKKREVQVLNIISSQMGILACRKSFRPKWHTPKSERGVGTLTARGKDAVELFREVKPESQAWRGYSCHGSSGKR